MDSLICHQYKLAWVRTSEATCTRPNFYLVRVTAWQFPEMITYEMRFVCMPILLLSYLNTIIIDMSN